MGVPFSIWLFTFIEINEKMAAGLSWFVSILIATFIVGSIKKNINYEE